MGSHLPPFTGSFTGPAETLSLAGILSDFDGTIVDSTAAIVKHWGDIAGEIGVDPKIILATSHGRRSIDTLAIHAPHLANEEFITKMEGALPLKFGDDATVLPGAIQLLESLKTEDVPWSIVTSGTRALLYGWIKVLGLEKPEKVVTAEDVDSGKPDPACYLKGLEKIGLDTAEVGREDGKKQVLVLEDAPAGVRAGKAAGCYVLGLYTTHSVETLVEAGADWIVKDLESLKIIGTSGGLTKVELTDIWTSQ